MRLSNASFRRINTSFSTRVRLFKPSRLCRFQRNLFLSLQSGLGVDTYPIGVDESPRRVLEILTVLQRLSQRYDKPLSARFVSDGRARIGERSDFGNQYLKDVVIRPL